MSQFNFTFKSVTDGMSTVRAENKFFKVIIRYFGDYEADSKAGFDASAIDVQVKPLKQRAVTLQFIVGASWTLRHGTIQIKDSICDPKDIPALCETLMIAAESLGEIEAAVRQYFPGVLSDAPDPTDEEKVAIANEKLRKVETMFAEEHGLSMEETMEKMRESRMYEFATDPEMSLWDDSADCLLWLIECELGMLPEKRKMHIPGRS